MKICLIDPSLFTWPYDYKLAEGLEENGHEVMIFGRDGRSVPAAESRLLDKHFYRGIETPMMRRLPKAVFLALKGFSHAASMIHLLFRMRRWKPDAIHFQWAPLAVIDKRFIPAFRRLAPTILTVHDSMPYNNNPAASVQRLGAIEIMRQFDHVIVHTAAARDRVAGYGVPPEKIHQVAHGLLLEPGTAPIDTAPMPRAASDSSVVLLLFGEIKPYKGADILLRAVALLPEDLKTRVLLRIVGRPRMEMEPLFALAADLGIKEQVDFDLRFVPNEEIGALMASADIQMFPYREIDASGVLMLTITAGRPIIASNIGLFREILDNRHGGLVPPDDPHALSAALARLVESPALRAECGAQVRALHGGIPAWREIARQTVDIYRCADANRQAHIASAPA